MPIQRAIGGAGEETQFVSTISRESTERCSPGSEVVARERKTSGFEKRSRSLRNRGWLCRDLSAEDILALSLGQYLVESG